ncbi:AAA family ATPase [Viridibacillus arvi]|uniref:sensor histidine kinase n=1 Tax=Viridibacillus arvi TaxID=263475 RepID=UPI003D2CC8BF
MPFQKNYETVDNLVTTNLWTLQRALSKPHSQKVLLKSVASSAQEQIARLHYEFEIASKLHYPWVLHPLTIENSGDLHILIYEDFNGIPLSEFIVQRPSLHQFLNIAIEIANIFIIFHQEQIIYKNISPKHILINPKTYQIKFFGFEYVSQLLKESPSATENPYERSDQLVYIAPEQTGQINTTVDHRSDLYALGALFYEMLAGCPPLEARDSSDLIYEILTKSPIPLQQRKHELPSIICVIVEKLLNKNQEDRYQSAIGLKEDLFTCWHMLTTDRIIIPFQLGQHEIQPSFGLLNKLYERTPEINILQEELHSVCEGEKSIVFVTGSPGIGKSTFVQELKQPIALAKGYFAVCKFEELHQDAQFIPVINSLRQLLKQIYLEGESSVATLGFLFEQEDLKLSPGLLTLLPELSWFIQTEVQVHAEHVDGTRQLHMFIMNSIKKILSAFTKQKKPFVLFIDDVQWADTNSMEMLEYMFKQHTDGYLFIIIAYREKEMSALHPLFSWQKDLEYPIYINLQPLSIETIDTWVKDSLNVSFSILRSLTQILHHFTKGNPLFVKETFLTFQREKLIYFDMKEKKWHFTLQKMDQSILNEEVLDLITQRIDHLKMEPRFILKMAACFGNQFSLDTLLTLVEVPAKDLLDYLNDLITEGFIIPLNANYKWAYSYEKLGVLENYSLSYQFVHDRIQQAAYKSLTEEDKENTHLSIGRILIELKGKQLENDRLIEAVKHLNYSKNLLSIQEKIDLANWNLQLGIKARHSGLFENALVYLTNSLELLPPNHWSLAHDLSIQIYTNLGECEYLTAHFELANEHFNTVLCYAKTKYEKLSINNLKTMLYTEADLSFEAIQSGREGLALYDIYIKETPSKLAVLKEYSLLKFELIGKKPDTLLHMKPMEKKEMRTILQILINMSGAAYIFNESYAAILMLRATRLLLKNGDTDISPIVFINHSLILSSGFGDYKNGFLFGQFAVDQVESQPNIFLRARVYFVFGTFVNHWKKPLEGNIYYLKKAQQYSFDTGIYHLVAASACFICSTQFIRNISLYELTTEVTRQREIVNPIKSTLSEEFLSEFNYWLDVLRQSQLPLIWDHPITTQSETSVTIMHLILRLNISYLLQEENQAQTLMNALKQPMKETPDLPITPQYYYYRALWQMRRISETRVKHRDYREYKKDINKSITKLRKWSRHSPENFEHLYILLKAENCRTKKLDGEAILFYDRAIQLSRLNGFIRDEAIACECVARYYEKQKKYSVARDYIMRGIDLMRRWGSERIAQKWEKTYANVIEKKLLSKAPELMTLDMKTVFETTQSLSKEINMDELLKKVLFALLKHAGANRGYFLKIVQDEIVLLAKSETSSSTFEMYKNTTLLQADLLMQSVVRYVFRSGEYVIINDAKEDSRFPKGKSSTKSVLCLPIHSKGDLKAILYLENSVVAYAFSSEKLELLKIISAQIAVSIENAEVYKELGDRVEERTQELAAMNNNLIEINSKLQQNELERKQLFNMISHDLRSPISSALGYIELILDGVITDAEQQSIYLHRSKERLFALNELIQDLFDLSNLESGRMAFQMEQITVEQLFRLLAEKYELDVQHANLQYSSTLHLNTNAIIQVDIKRIEQVLTNLIQNAIKYTKQGHIHFSMQIDSDNLICSVEDTGIGIPANEIAFIFDRHYGSSNKNSTNSHGIGLAICKKIILQHQGEIFVESVENEGSTFSFTLPLVSSPIMQ